MSRQLRAIRDWAARAAEAGYCVNGLAGLCAVSPSSLARHFARVFGTTPHEWLHEQRMKRARELLMDETSVKETAILLAYRHTSHFTRDFRLHHGYPPGEHVSRILKATGQTSKSSEECH
jgi:AraC-like DNA-binding protein